MHWYFMFRLDASISILRERKVDTAPGEPSRGVAEVLVRRVPENQQVNIRNCVQPCFSNIRNLYCMFTSYCVTLQLSMESSFFCSSS